MLASFHRKFKFEPSLEMRGEARRRVIAKKNRADSGAREAKGYQRVGISACGTKAYTQSRCDASSIKMRRSVTRGLRNGNYTSSTAGTVPAPRFLGSARLHPAASPSQSHEDPVAPGLRTRRQREIPKENRRRLLPAPQDEAKALSLWSRRDVFGTSTAIDPAIFSCARFIDGGAAQT